LVFKKNYGFKLTRLDFILLQFEIAKCMEKFMQMLSKKFNVSFKNIASDLNTLPMAMIERFRDNIYEKIKLKSKKNKYYKYIDENNVFDIQYDFNFFN